MNAIEVRGLVKTYGTFKALDGLDIDVPQGTVFGFIGPNGAGKTTTTRIIVGLAHATSGSVEILGHDALNDPASVKRLMGYVPDVPAFYEWMTAADYLTFIGELFGLRGRELNKRVGELIDVAGLTGIRRPVGGFSRGMKQRLGIAQAFINNPEILFLDEPTSALDPIGRKEVLDMIESLSKKKTVFFSTHILADVERVCDSVAIIHKGRIITQGGLEELKNDYARPVFAIEVDDSIDLLAAKLASIPWISSVSTDEQRMLVHVSDVRRAQTELLGIVSELRVPVRLFELRETSLEDIFIGLINDQNATTEPIPEKPGVHA